jgi:hypothetical protein
VKVADFSNSAEASTANTSKPKPDSFIKPPVAKTTALVNDEKPENEPNSLFSAPSDT